MTATAIPTRGRQRKAMTTAPRAPDNLRRMPSVEPSGDGVVLSILHPAHRAGRTMFSSRVFDPDEVDRVLVDGQQSRKIGKVVQKGRWRDFPIFMLTLEERATCPRSCGAWASCYGNNMHAAQRIMAGPALEAALWDELAALQARHPGGFVVRLHILGDFYSVDYVALWAAALDAYPALHVFGYTARDRADPIGSAIADIVGHSRARFAIRFSGWNGPTDGAVIVDTGEATPHLICPAQTGATSCCATCALCWHSDRTIAFLRH